MNLNENRKAIANTGLVKVAVQCSADTFVVNQSLVFRINICGENRHLRQARKRYERVYSKTTKPIMCIPAKLTPHSGKLTTIV